MPEFKDELDKLRAALRDATPASDEASKEAALRVAEENFANLQGSATAARPTDTSPQRTGLLKGLGQMFMKPNLKPMMLATSSLVIIGVGVVLTMPLMRSDQAPVTSSEPLVPPVMAPEVDVAAEQPALAKVAERPETPIAELVEAPLEAEAELFVTGDFGTTTMADTVGSAVAPPAPSSKRLARSMGVTAIEGAAPSGLTASNAAPLRDRLPQPQIAQSNDQFPDATPNPLKVTSEEPVSTFSIDVDTASYSWLRSSLSRGQLPDPKSVRVEELVNYFPYAYPAPEGDVPFQQTVTVSETPWSPDTQLMHIAIQGARVEERPPLNLVFLLDTSGSMQDANKLPLLVQSFRLMLGQLRPEDEVAIVTYAGSAGTVLEPTKASERRKIEDALLRLSAGGSTAGGEGLRAAYALADQMSRDGEVSRVLLATDGDFNVGMQSDAELKGFVEQKRKSGTYLSVFGFGRGNVNDALMQTLAQNGNGQAAYIDTLAEAQKVLVDQLSGAMFAIAQDVKIQVEFNPATVAEYRLIGYETRALKREDFNNDKVDAGEIGAGHTVTALYEVTPVGSDAVLTDPLRFGTVAADGNTSDLAFLRLRYKEPGATQSKLLEEVVPVGTGDVGSEAAFSAAIAGFGQLLRGNTALREWGYSDAIALANANKGDDEFGYRAEAVKLMRLAQSLSPN
ncbi:Ca-activated chloride channel family protein [Litoreibacter halocynthiae]|uniref:Ca-activated chloride channel family protein n=1 Tax=Litoreibacter halocynthiae TaxID=1242689 RepID=A0A4R7LHT8_9RHOB|nr:VWA domain-containing protein [Litoreibacter halocynthiae]TDT75338.1 Ca-activated chloride channel family protein [Litoreibacter halocynthiae]